MRNSYEVIEIDVNVVFENLQRFIFAWIFIFDSFKFIYAKTLVGKSSTAKTLVFGTKLLKL